MDIACETTVVGAAALHYAECGLLVFPVPPASKQSFKSAQYSGGRRWGATRDPEEIEYDWSRWPYANVGIATGEASGIFVVEVDTPERTWRRWIHGAREATGIAADPNGAKPLRLAAFLFLLPYWSRHSQLCESAW